MDFITMLGLFFGALGAFGVIYTFIQGWRHKKYPGQLIYTEVYFLDLKNRIASNFDGFKLLHGDKSINHNVTYLCGALINTGLKDLICDSEKDKITLSLPDGMSWLDVKINQVSEGVNSNIEIDNKQRNKAYINIAILKKKESVRFESLIETKNSVNESIDIDFSHRILDTAQVKKFTKSNGGRRDYFKRSLIRQMVILIFFTLYFLFKFLFSGYINNNNLVKYSKVNDDSDTLYIAKCNEKDEVLLYCYNDKLVCFPIAEQTISKTSFLENYELETNCSNKYNYFVYGVLYLVMVIMLVYIGYESWLIYREEKISKYLKK